MVDFVLNIFRKLGFRDFYEPDSETLNNDTQLARETQSKSIRDKKNVELLIFKSFLSDF